MFTLSSKKNTHIHTDTIRSPEGAFSIPVFSVSWGKNGKTLCVTAGMDGDEYASIDAAYTVIEKYEKIPFLGSLIVLPIINMPGFMDEVSFNPLDRRFPKYHLIPNGSSSSNALITHIIHTYVEKSDMWLDLHGGALTESLTTPFLWAHETNTPVDAFIRTLLASMDAEVALIEKDPTHVSSRLATHAIAYLLTECGEYGKRSDSYTKQQLSWIASCMQQLGMLPKKNDKEKTNNIKIFTSISYVMAPNDGLWTPSPKISDTITHKEIVGNIMSFTGKKTDIVSKAAGKILWKKTGMRAKRFDTLCAVGR